MLLLGIDTSSQAATAALSKDGAIICEYTLNQKKTHSAQLLPMIEQMLKASGYEFSDIDAFACGVGPGSFTGVRIGVSIIKGLAFGKNIPCVPVSTLDALAENLRPMAEALGHDFYVCPVMDARRSQVYTALFLYETDADGNTVKTRVWEDDMLSAAELEQHLSALELPVLFVGEGCRVTQREIHLPHCKEAPEAVRYQSGVSVASAARAVYEAAEDKSVFTDLALKPTYLRPSQAERERAEKQG
jgi:tRNA threonylcarbamoyladenosine biosynthesis protein TsaB